MVTAIRKRNVIETVTEEVKPKYIKPQIGQEKKMIDLERDGYTQAEYEESKKELIEHMELKGYIEIKKDNDIKLIFGEQTESAKKQKRTGRKVFFVWKLSGWLDMLILFEKKETLIKKLNKNNISVILNTVREQKLLQSTYVLDEFGIIQLTDSTGRLRDKDSMGKAIYVQSSTPEIVYPKKRDVEIEDIPLAMIEEIIKVEDIKKYDRNLSLKHLQEFVANFLWFGFLSHILNLH
jgi:hypothetical protein